MQTLTVKQRDTNASNAVLGGLVIGSVIGQRFSTLMFLVGLGLYLALIVVALLLEK